MWFLKVSGRRPRRLATGTAISTVNHCALKCTAGHPRGPSWIKATIGEFGPRHWLDRSCCSDDLYTTRTRSVRMVADHECLSIRDAGSGDTGPTLALSSPATKTDSSRRRIVEAESQNQEWFPAGTQAFVTTIAATLAPIRTKCYGQHPRRCRRARPPEHLIERLGSPVMGEGARNLRGASAP